MILVALYLVSFGVLWFAMSFSVLILYWPLSLLRMKPTPPMMLIVSAIAAMLLLWLTQIIWAMFGYSIGWFPFLVAIQNLISANSKMSNGPAKIQGWGFFVGSLVFGFFIA